LATFETLGVSPDLVAALAADGIDTPFAIQALTIPDVLAGRDICGKAKTGSGKTLAFGLPMLQGVSKAKPRHPTGLVLVPTRELANQVADVLVTLGERRGVAVHAVYGGVSMEQQIKALRQGVDIVIGTPGRLIDLLERKEMSLSAVEVLVLDEADRMADMGFMPQVQKILYRIERSHQTLLFSATLDGAVNQLVRRYMKEPVFHEVASKEATVEEMKHHFFLVHQMDKVRVAAAIARGARRTLVFVRTKRGADRLVQKLTRRGIDAVAMHGDLTQRAREKALARFSEGKVTTLVATDVAARGLDLSGITHVINFDPPEDDKGYVHRVGRTGRAGRSGSGITLVLPEQQADVSRVVTRLGHREEFEDSGMSVARPRKVYSSRRGRGSRW
jgi:superfamily II DNA/RNA helicase